MFNKKLCLVYVNICLVYTNCEYFQVNYLFINKYKERPGGRSSTQTYNEKEYRTLYAFFFSLCSFSTKRALLKAPNDQDLYKKGAQDMVCILLNLGTDLIQNSYLVRK